MIKSILRSFLIFILALLLLIAFLFCTRTGMQILIPTISALIPGNLQAKVAPDYKLGHLHLQALVYQDDDVDLQAQNLIISWSIQLYSPFVIAFPEINFHDLKIMYKHQPVYQALNLDAQGQLALDDLKADAALKDPIAKTYFNIAWQAMNIPINPAFNIAFPEGHLFLTGPLFHYQLTGNFTTSGHDFLQASWQLHQAEGNFEQLTISSLTSDALKGQVILSAKVKWLPVVSWDAHLTGNHLTTLLPWPELKNNFNLHLHSQGLITDTKKAYRFELKQLDGLLADYPVKGSGNIFISNEDYTFQNFKLQLGNADLALSGKLNPQQANINWQLILPDLAKLDSLAQGTLTSSGSIQGTSQNPHILANLQVEKAAFNDISLAHLNAKIDAYPNVNDASELSINASNMVLSTVQLQSAQLHLTNKNRKNQLTLALIGPQANLHFQAAGNIIAKKWQGKIQQLLLDIKPVGEIKLIQPTALTFSPQGFNLQPFCLSALKGQTCIEQATLNIKPIKKDVSALQGLFKFSSKNLNSLSLLFPQLVDLQGDFAANFHLSGTNKAPIISGQAKLDHSSFSIPEAGIQVKQISLQAKGDKDTLHYEGKATLGEGILNINGDTALTKADFPTKITIKGNNLLVMQSRDANVKINPDLQLLWQFPLLTVTGDIHIPYAKITPRDLSSTVTLPRDVVFVTAGQEEKATHTNIHTHVKITLGDDISFSYAGLSGKIDGAVMVEDKPGGDTIGSGILNIINGNYKAYGQNLNIRQGKLIYTGGPIDNPGLSIQAIKQLQTVTTSTSAPSNSKSTLGGYSSNLQTVGVSVTGSLSQPSIKLFAEPSGLSQADILSYLILGRPASQATQQDNPSILQALSLLNMDTGNGVQLKNQLSSAFGLSDLSVSHEQEYDQENNSVVQNTSLLLGKVLSPGLMVSYSLGLAEPINTLKIIYKLQKNLSLQSTHSTNANGVDLFYTYERN